MDKYIGLNIDDEDIENLDFDYFDDENEETGNRIRCVKLTNDLILGVYNKKTLLNMLSDELLSKWEIKISKKKEENYYRVAFKELE